MKDFRSFFKSKEEGFRLRSGSFPKKSGDAVSRVAMFSAFFSDLPDNFFCSNNMYAEFRDSILSTIDIYRTSEKLVIDLFERRPSGKEEREIALVGFRKYIRACYQKLWSRFITQIITISAFALLGVLLEFLVYSIQPELSQWVLKCIDIMGNVLIWQFVGYWAFEFSGQYRELRRLKQIYSLDFCFHVWD